MPISETQKILSLLHRSKNIILQGAPGTGKTWIIPEIVTRLCGKIKSETASRVEVIKAYNALLDSKQVVFTTFHPSYDYDDFVEGWKPGTSSDSPLQIQPGIFRSLCENAQTAFDPKAYELDEDSNEDSANVWAVSLGGRIDNDIHDDCLKNNRIRIGWADYSNKEVDALVSGQKKGSGDVNLRQFYQEMKPGDYVIVPRSGEAVTDAIGRLPQEIDPKHSIIMLDDNLEGRNGLCPRSRNIEWLWRGNPTDISAELIGNQGLKRHTISNITERFPPSKVYDFIKRKTAEQTSVQSKATDQDKIEKFVLVIDEINRGNISKIFGELITLLESDKRSDGETKTQVTLPFSHQTFCVPSNVYVIGTMNTADRSIGTIDYALRRRFDFYQMKPHSLNDNFNHQLFNKVRQIFITEGEIPNRDYLSEEFNPFDVMPGQSYFIAKDKNEKKHVFEYRLKPLLEEYLRDGVLLESARQIVDELDPLAD